MHTLWILGFGLNPLKIDIGDSWKFYLSDNTTIFWQSFISTVFIENYFKSLSTLLCSYLFERATLHQIHSKYIALRNRLAVSYVTINAHRHSAAMSQNNHIPNSTGIELYTKETHNADYSNQSWFRVYMDVSNNRSTKKNEIPCIWNAWYRRNFEKHDWEKEKQISEDKYIPLTIVRVQYASQWSSHPRTCFHICKHIHCHHPEKQHHQHQMVRKGEVIRANTERLWHLCLAHTLHYMLKFMW